MPELLSCAMLGPVASLGPWGWTSDGRLALVTVVRSCKQSIGAPVRVQMFFRIYVGMYDASNDANMEAAYQST